MIFSINRWVRVGGKNRKNKTKVKMREKVRVKNCVSRLQPLNNDTVQSYDTEVRSYRAIKKNCVYISWNKLNILSQLCWSAQKFSSWSCAFSISLSRRVSSLFSPSDGCPWTSNKSESHMLMCFLSLCSANISRPRRYTTTLMWELSPNK